MVPKLPRPSRNHPFVLLAAISIMVDICLVICLGIGMVSCSKTAKVPEEKYFVAESMGKVVSVYCDAYHGNTTIQTEFWSIPIRDSMIVPLREEIFMRTIKRGITVSKYITWNGCSARYVVYESNMYSLPLTED